MRNTIDSTRFLLFITAHLFLPYYHAHKNRCQSFLYKFQKGAFVIQLIITEKPSVAQSIAKVLGCTTRKNGYIESKGFIVSWCIGHLIELAEPEMYNPALKRWTRETLPIMPDVWQYRVTEATRKQFEVLQSLMRRKDVESLICATDAGREGELIFRLVYEQCGCKKSFSRLWISSMEDEAIREGFAHLKPSTEYDKLYNAALCRERADWIVGINATRLFSCLYHQTLNIGRVMTPTLAMVVQREAAIRAFAPQAFYTVLLEVSGMQVQSERFADKDTAAALVEQCQTAGSAKIVSVMQTEKSEKPPLLYDLTALQRDANRLLGYTAQQTLDYLQSIYEKKLTTYPRTDSRYLTEDLESSLPVLVNMVQRKCDFDEKVSAFVNAKQVINGAKVSDHHAIIPTKSLANADLSALPQGEQAVLRLICTRLLCAVGAPYRYLETSIEMECAGQKFKTKGKTVLDLGWKAFAGKETHDTELAAVEENAYLPITNADIKQGQTQPPKHFTEDLLLQAMETASADEIPKEAERRGLGTPATRAGIIEKLVRVGYLERKGEKKTKILVPTDKGNALVTVVPEQLQSPSLTAEWEQMLLQIERGEQDSAAFMQEISGMVSELVQTAQPIEGAGVILPANAPMLGKCPACGGEVLDKHKGYFCVNPACKFALWKENRYFASIGKTLTPKIAEELLTHCRVKLKGCKSARTGKIFDASLLLDVASDGNVKFNMEFEKKEAKH